MNIQPVDENEYKMRNVWPVGWYACTIASAEEKMSNSGNEFFRCEVHVFNDTGAFRKVMANIIGTGNAAFQLREAAEAFDLLERYKGGALEAADLVGRSCYCKLTVEEDKSGQYDPKNVVRSWRREAPKGKARAEAPAQEQPVDDDIPF